MNASPHLFSKLRIDLVVDCTLRILTLLAAAIFATVGNAAQAAAGGYVGVRAGISDDRLTDDERSGVGELFGGVRVDAHWAVELGLFGTHKSLGEVIDHEGNTLKHSLG